MLLVLYVTVSGKTGVQKLKRDVLGWIRPGYRPFRAQNWLK